MRVGRTYRISGRVQGVGFRLFAEATAAREGLDGWVRNLPDGRIEISIEGEAESVGRFERHISHGPPGARIVDLSVDETVPTHPGSGFSIR